MSLTFAMDVNAPVEKVFDCVDDDQKLKIWVKGLEETIYPSGKNPNDPVGTKFVQKIREGRRVQQYDGEVIAYRKPEHIAVTISNAYFSADVDYRFTDVVNKTHLDYSCDIHCKSRFFKIVLLLFGWLNKLILKRQMKRLKALAEG
jgi:uncharacterized protein YndB with AHSA1/START domain